MQAHWRPIPGVDVLPQEARQVVLPSHRAGVEVHFSSRLEKRAIERQRAVVIGKMLRDAEDHDRIVRSDRTMIVQVLEPDAAGKFFSRDYVIEKLFRHARDCQ